jgi:hypothetical protein
VVEHEATVDPREEIFRLAVANGWVLTEMTPRATTLEDVFVRLTTRDTVDEPALSAAEV